MANCISCMSGRQNEPLIPLRLSARAGTALLAGLAMLCMATPTLSQYPESPGGSNLELICPCTAEPVEGQPYKAKVTAVVQNLDEEESGGLYLKLNLLVDGLRYDLWRFTKKFPPLAGKETRTLSGTVDILDISDGMRPYPASAVNRMALVLSDVKDGGGSIHNKVIFPALPDSGLTERVTNVDYLTDSDGDGVSDYNERLMGTLPGDADSKPGMATLDIYGVYPEYPAPHQGRNFFFGAIDDHIECIHHSVEWANMALRNSRINARYRLVSIKPVETNPFYPRDGGELFGEALNGYRRFAGMDAEREKVGGDILVVFTGGGEGSVLQIESFETDPGKARRHAVSQSSCRGRTLAHELGHNLGLRHSPRQAFLNRGMFRWSRGHGEEGDFVTIMAYYAAYEAEYPINGGILTQFYSNPDLALCGKAGDRPCGQGRDQPLAADAALSIRTVMYKAAQWAPDPKDDDGDGILNELDAFPKDPTEHADNDDDGIGDNADLDDDNDGLADVEEEALGTNPWIADSDGDSVPDGLDLHPRDNTRSLDADGDGLDAIVDANDNDAGMTWTRANVTLTPDATLAANIIATFDDPAALRANKARYEVTGVFADPNFISWEHDFAYPRDNGFYPGRGRVGAAAVNTLTFNEDQHRFFEPPSSITIKDIVVNGDYINFLMYGGAENFSGVRLSSAGTGTLLADFKLGYFGGYSGDMGWWHFDVSELEGQAVSIEIYHRIVLGYTSSGTITFDHFYQSDLARGWLVGTATYSDSDGDGVLDGLDAFPDDPYLHADRDRDGLGDRIDNDNDNDRTPDDQDAFPFYWMWQKDSDGDGVGDFTDHLKDDPSEWHDSFRDGLGDNADLDDDDDGVPDAEDAFPRNNRETLDTDGDRIGDNRDADDDNDGLLDTDEVAGGTDPKRYDTDGDGVNDRLDIAPSNPAIAYRTRGVPLNRDARDGRNVIADLDDLTELRIDAFMGRYDLTGVFANEDLTHWNFFEEQDARVRESRRTTMEETRKKHVVHDGK